MKASRASALSDYVQVLRRDAWIIAATTALIALIAIVFSLLQEDRYESHADVFLSGTSSIPGDFGYEQQRDIDPERAGNTQARLARVPAVAGLTLREAKLSDRSTSDLLDNSTVSQPPETDILRFTVNDKSADVAPRLATAYATAFTRYRYAQDVRSLAGARRKTEERLRGIGRRDPLYPGLTQQYNQLRTAEQLLTSTASVVRRGTDAIQVQPKPIRNGILGGLLGLLLGVGLVVLREGLNTRVRDPDEVEQTLGLPMIGRVPRPSRRNGARSGLAMLDSPEAPETESYRMIATNIGFVNLDRGAKSIMVTSAADGEGKSTTIANLAIAMARAGSRVALIDFDLKRPSLDGLFDLDVAQFGVGVTGVALGQISLDDALIRIPVSDVDPAGSLDVLLTGQVPPDSAQFIASQRVTDLLTRLADRYDIVLIDAAPIVQASDAVALAGKVDAVIVIAGLSLVRRGTLEELRRILEGTPVTKLGFVLTGVPMDDAYRHVYSPPGAQTNGSTSHGRRQASRVRQ